MKHLSINVIGKVQGVYFRASTKMKADELGLKGTVMNLPNGSVQIELLGAEKSTIKFIKWCHDGPEHANVKEVICQETIEPKSFPNFEILR